MPRHALQRHQVRVGGSGRRTLVFAHGFGCDQAMWRFVAPAFESGHRVVLYDHAGCGGADPVPPGDQRHLTLYGYAQDLLDILDELALDEVVFVGHSIGGVIGLLASIQAPARFARLVLVGPSPRFLDEPPDYVGGFQPEDLDGLFELMESNHFGWARFLAPLAMGEANPAALTRDFEDQLCALDPEATRRFARLVFQVDVRDRLPQVTVPSLIIQCTHDSIAPRAVGAYLHRHLAGSRLVELEASGHCPHVSHPAEVIAALQDELQRLDAADA